MPRRASLRASDIVVAVVATVLQLAGARFGRAVPPVDALAGAFGAVLGTAAVAVQGGSLLWRRSRPVLVLSVCVVAYLVNAMTVPGVPPYAAWFALYAAVRYAQPGRRAGYAAAAGARGIIAAVLASGIPYPDTLGGALPLVLVTVIVVLVGVAVRTRRAQLDALRDRAAALERAAESTAARAAAEERLRIARDLHDLVGHGLSGIAVQSSTARMALDHGRLEQARVALSAVESSSRAALSEMRQLIGVLRAADPGEYAPAPGMADLPDLIEGVRTRGTSVTFGTDEIGPLPPAVSLCVYRVVQEGLTNAVKHAPDHAVTVRVSAADGDVVVTVADHAAGLAASPNVPEPTGEPRGHGLVGMRERVSALGGSLVAGPVSDRAGWCIQARIPLRDEEP